MSSRIERIGGLAMAAVTAASGIAWLLLPKGDSPGTKIFALYVLREAFFDVVVTVSVVLVIRLAVQSQGLRFLASHPVAAMRSPAGGIQVKTLVAILLILGIFGSGLFYGVLLFRARAYYWRALVRTGYVERTVARVDLLMSAGYIGDAYSTASEVASVVKDAPGAARLSRRLLYLQGRLKRSQQLSGQYPLLSVEQWNPISQRRAYFAHAEALRLNPQNYLSAEALTAMRGRLSEDFEHDASAICEDAPKLRTVSLMDTRTFEPWSAERCVDSAKFWLEGLWDTYTIDQLLQWSLDTAGGTEVIDERIEARV